ncbi:hypothetical protein BDZ45DRAFT_756256 [Acephala macrosclerotiorum]|nr:hypothetical protein BDZ45DRAFT_756256 [Acephala macrosclerotiorum]
MAATLTSLTQRNSTDKLSIGRSDPFFSRTDPTLCVAGLDSGRPQDFLDTLTVLLDHELDGDTSSVNAIFTGVTNPAPIDHGLQSTTTKLLAQCLRNANTKNGISGPVQTTGFQAWGNGNPFIPLFIEWESIYYHVEIAKWDVQLQSTPWGHNHSYVRYVPTDLLSGDPSNQSDFRSLSSRILILPQPVFSLENIVTSILDNLPAGISLAPGEEDFIKSHIRDMKFISAPLSGITSHLPTRCDGAHVKPVVRVQGQQIEPLAVAAVASRDIGIDSDVLRLVDTESAFTPYGKLMTFGTDEYPKDKNPFKPVTHGQMLFTKLNIVDKFGQAICLPSPRPRLRNEPHPPDSKIYLCLTDYLAPEVIGTTVNTIFPTAEPVQPDHIPPCEYIQLPPSINQDARIDAAFLVRDTVGAETYSAWREASEYESPIFGWVIINYEENGLQFFLADGTFYREVRVGGADTEAISPKWLPNNPPGITHTDAGTAQPEQLIMQLSPKVEANATYLRTFSEMINGSILNMPFPPSDYAGYANAIVGKLLALVTIKPQNSLGNATSNAQADLEEYSFPLKIGDIERSYDGVVGYYLSSNEPGSQDMATDWNKMYTYFLPNPNSKFQDISQPSKTLLPNLHPYYVDPTSTADVNAAHAAKFTVTSLLIDPYTAIHGFSPILPTKSLTLPSWTIQTAFQKMHAFFHLGPNLYTADVPRRISDAETHGTVVKMPVSGNKGTWSWFQPYATSDPSQLDPEYAEIEVQEDLVGQKWAKGPFTFLEGYLQLMG